MSNDREEDVANVEREAAAQQSPQSGAGLVTGTTTPHAAAKGLPDAVAVVGLSERGTMFDPDRAHSNLIGPRDQIALGRRSNADVKEQLT